MPGRIRLGFSTHTGWAAVIAVSGTKDAPAIVERRLIEMMPKADRARPRFVFHAAREMALDAARRFVSEAAEMSRAAAVSALKQLLSDLHGDVRAAGLIAGAPKAAAPLESVLKSHSAIHAAEGELFRDAVRQACAELKIPVLDVRARDLPAKAATLLGLSPPQLERRLAEIGREAGKPWAKDQKDAFLAALLA